MILLDTSVLIDTFTADRVLLPQFRAVTATGAPLGISTPVLYEWLRGPRVPAELKRQEDLFPSARALPFGPEDAAIAARLYRSLRRPRSRELDIAIAACAIRHEAQLWTLNPADFADIPGLRLYRDH